jgi:isopentenyldiphosphate isomerase
MMDSLTTNSDFLNSKNIVLAFDVECLGQWEINPVIQIGASVVSEYPNYRKLDEYSYCEFRSAKENAADSSLRNDAWMSIGRNQKARQSYKRLNPEQTSPFPCKNRDNA